ncbi:hypothetical protein K239x_33140 [Planctomycetes bacterium K23_9]|uniref:Uncharacterized protein n=1 Tax=Stieleria marina TaxID=1930275 RepID=A0A517NW19_9BACT|nr:hypothetical protein K239x_33140 [Planctomycetes bacterium K23_9]
MSNGMQGVYQYGVDRRFIACERGVKNRQLGDAQISAQESDIFAQLELRVDAE